MQLKLLDHIIMSNNGYFSFRQNSVFLIYDSLLGRGFHIEGNSKELQGTVVNKIKEVKSQFYDNNDNLDIVDYVNKCLDALNKG